MDMSEMLPLMMMMMNKNNASAQAADSGRQAPDFEKVMETLNKSGGNPMDAFDGMQGVNPEMMRMFKLITEMNGRGKSGGVPTDLLLEVMGGGNPQFKQMKTLMDMYGKMNKNNRGPTIGTMSSSPPPINELRPIRTIAPDAIHKSMEDYLKHRRM